MKGPTDISQTEGTTLRTAALVAGIAYLFALVQGFALGFPANAVLVVPGNITATAASIASHELLYRITLLNELIMYTSVIVLAVALYVVLKTINNSIAFVALGLRLAEAIVSMVAVLASYLVLEFLREPAGALTVAQGQALGQIFLNGHTLGTRMGLLFTGLGSIPFYYLFYRSKYVPKVLSGIGIIVYALMLVAVVLDMLTPGSSPKSLTTSIIEFAPVIAFETLMGLWLVIRRVKV